ncbi:hypothetical protein DASC09_056290 [Saccharomycopsis crataegensis]|uniref:Uncharacterized protein n=1 Tax=Saccharomycopsis crataegensis TaxID=43959 RepID=A0AAV5QTN6_9ASCO|nr:hypothetical protein DASC09_056290 [Saccharomycopsis crataegensis]
MGYDGNLCMALQLCLIGNRHLLVSSADPVYTERELIHINDELFKFKPKSELRSLICDSKTSLSLINRTLEKDTGRLLSNTKDVIDDAPTNAPVRTVLIIRGLERTSDKFQVALLEIIRNVETKRKSNLKDTFLIIPIIESIEGNEICLYKYLQEKFWFRQPHSINYQTANYIFNSDPSDSEVSSISSDSIINEDLTVPELLSYDGSSPIEDALSKRERIDAVSLIPEIKRYILDIMIFIRNHRIVTDGIPTRFIWEFELLVRCLAIVNNYEYVIPVIVKLAARKFFPLKINICNYEDEPTLNWGSDLLMVKMMMNKWNADLVVEDVLNKVQAPI